MAGGSPVTIEHVAQPAGRRAEQVAQHSEHVAVAAGVVEDGLETNLALDDQRRRKHAHAALGPGAVEHVDRIHPGFLKRAALLDHLGWVPALRRQNLDGGHQLARGELLPQPGALRQRDRFHPGRPPPAAAAGWPTGTSLGCRLAT